MATKLTKLKTYFIDDGAKRGPMTMSQVRFHPSQSVLLAACADRRLACWNLDANEEKLKNITAVPGVFVCPHEVGWVRCVDIAPNGQTIVTGGSDRRLKIWAWNNTKPAEKVTKDIEAHAGWVEAVAFSPDGKRIVTGGADHLVKVWNATDLSLLKSLPTHTGFVRDVAWLPDGSAFVTGAEDGKLAVWDSTTYELKRTLIYGNTNEQFGQNPALSGVHRLHVSRDSKYLAATGSKSCVLFDLVSGQAVAEDKFDTQVAFSPAEDVLAVGSNNAKVIAYDRTKFQPGKPDKNGKPTAPAALAGKELAQIKIGDFSLGMRFSNTGKLLGLGRADGKVEVWEVA